MFYAKKILTALVLPPFGLILLAALGLWVAHRHPRIGRAMAFMALAAMLALSMPPVAGALMRSLERFPPISAENLGRAQAIVILSSGVYQAAPEYDGGTVDRSSLQRERYGVWLQKRSNLPILVTGGSPWGGRLEVDATKELIESEFQGKVKWVEGASWDTADNAAFSAKILKGAGMSRIALVSDAWHLQRAVELFERQGLEVLAAPTAFYSNSPSLFVQAIPSIGALQESTIALREWLGILVQRLTK